MIFLWKGFTHWLDIQIQARSWSCVLISFTRYPKFKPDIAWSDFKVISSSDQDITWISYSLWYLTIYPKDLPFSYTRGSQFDYRSLMPNFIIILNYMIFNSLSKGLAIHLHEGIAIWLQIFDAQLYNNSELQNIRLVTCKFWLCQLSIQRNRRASKFETDLLVHYFRRSHRPMMEGRVVPCNVYFGLILVDCVEPKAKHMKRSIMPSMNTGGFIAQILNSKSGSMILSSNQNQI